MNHVDKQKGFTIVELLLAMTFVSILLLSIALVVIQISNIYNKGLTLRAVDQSGRTVSADIQRVLGQTQPLANLEGAFVIQRGDAASVNDSPLGGRFCTGEFTYIWNYGVALDENNYRPINTYVTNPNDPEKELRFVRIRDSDSYYCTNNDGLPDVARDGAVELLAEGDRNLVVHDFSVEQIAYDPLLSQALYRVKMQLGTNDQTALTTADMSCKPPSEESAFQEFCAVNVFEFTAQVGNKGEE